jgi:hypothetical protein
MNDFVKDKLQRQLGQNANPATDSKTNVDILRTRFSDKLTVRADPETKKEFLRFCDQTGFSECQLVDMLIRALFCKVNIDKLLVDKSPTINLTVERQVMRVRRYGRTVSDEKWNFYDGRLGSWLHVDGELNNNGHGVGCQCSVCRKGPK